MKAASEAVLIPGFIVRELGLVAVESSRKDPLLQAVRLLREASARLVAVQTKPSPSRDSNITRRHGQHALFLADRCVSYPKGVICKESQCFARILSALLGGFAV